MRPLLQNSIYSSLQTTTVRMLTEPAVSENVNSHRNKEVRAFDLDQNVHGREDQMTSISSLSSMQDTHSSFRHLCTRRT